MKNEVLNHYLYISWDKKREEQAYSREFASYMMVAKAMIKDELSEQTQVLNDNILLFSSNEDFETIQNKLKHKQFPYMLIDISLNVSMGLISTFLQECEIEVLNKFITESDKNQVDYFQRRLEQCINDEEYESACVFRDLIKNKMIEKQ
jgi:replicative superfamily II helicase